MSDQPKHAQPGDAQPGDAQPGDAQPGDAQPEGAQPEGAQPEGAQPGDAQPEDAQPKVAQPEADEPENAQAVAQLRPSRASTRQSAFSFLDPLEYGGPCSAISTIFSCFKNACCQHAHEQPLEEPMEAAVNARITHYWAMFIPRIHCFLLPATRSVSKSVKDVLGFCVRFQNLKCDAACVKCAKCKTCPHQYTCSCPNFEKLNGLWCAHIHLIQMMTGGLFRGQVCLYIQTDTRFMQLRHLRAAVLGSSYMTRKDKDKRIFHEEVNYFVWSPGVTKRVYSCTATYLGFKNDRCRCPRGEYCVICGACRCLYMCNCLDFEIDGQVCQHVHNAAMVWRGKSFNKDEAMPKPSIRNDEPAALWDWTIEYSVVLEHEMSLYIDLEEEVERMGTGSSSSEASSGTEERSYYVYGGIDLSDPRRNVVDVLIEGVCPICDVSDRITLSKMCLRCMICRHNYRCSCPLNNLIICRHVHAVHRKLKQLKETPEQAVSWIDFFYRIPVIYCLEPCDPCSLLAYEPEEREQSAVAGPSSAGPSSAGPSSAASPSAESPSAEIGPQSIVAKMLRDVLTPLMK